MTSDWTVCDCDPCTTLRERGVYYAECEYEEDDEMEPSNTQLDWDDDDYESVGC